MSDEVVASGAESTEETEEIDYKNAYEETAKQSKKFEKELKLRKDENAGLDRKVTELSGELKKIQRVNLPKEELRRLDEQDEARKRASEDAEKETLIRDLQAKVQRIEFRDKMVSLVNKKAMPAALRIALTEDRPDDLDELDAWIENLIAEYELENRREGNKGKVGSRPQSGGTVARGIPGEKEWNKMGDDEKNTWIHNATAAQLDELQNQGFTK
ncbi:MAG TPA: hypothetical protein VMW91_04640 [Desulfosporosinus sp.]|nr:hypothetical protein [Desulfosporosinus sp.]